MLEIYLDNAATTKIAPTVLDKMMPYLTEEFGNPSAKYYERGKRTRKAVLNARQQVARLINANIPEDEDRVNEIVFTSCATESNNWVIKSVLANSEKKHVITSSIEHHAVLETCEYMAEHGAELTVIDVDEFGQVDPQTLKAAMREDTALVTIMSANNEVGTVQPIKELAKITHEGGALFHTDAVQAAGKIVVDVKDTKVDFLSLSGHKFNAPKGIGVLYIKKGTRIEPFLHGGGQEGKRRAGTLNVASIVGIGAAAELATERLSDSTYASKQSELVEKLWKGISAAIPKTYRNGHQQERLPNILNVRFAGAEGEAILLRLDMFGVQVASGSACSTGDITPSHVLMAMGIPQEDVHGSIRFSLSGETTVEDIEKVIEILPAQVQMIRDMSVTWNG